MPGGRPKKPEVILPHFGRVTDVSQDRLLSMVAEIKERLPDASDFTVGLLTKAALDFMFNLAMQKIAPLLKRETQGRRPELALQWLLVDCATIHQRITSDHPLDTLRTLASGRNEGPEDTGALYHHPIIRYAGVILVVLGVEHDGGWRRQLRGAYKRYLAQHPEVCRYQSQHSEV